MAADRCRSVTTVITATHRIAFLAIKRFCCKIQTLYKPMLLQPFKTAIYFWMTPQTLKPSAHDVMIGQWQPKSYDLAKGRKPGFGMTIDIVNGEVECNKGENMYNMNDPHRLLSIFPEEVRCQRSGLCLLLRYDGSILSGKL